MNATTGAASPGINYWPFYWPLALNGTIVLLASILRNRALAGHHDAKYELAVFAIAFSVFQLFDAVLVFMPQTANVLVSSIRTRREVQRFAIWVSISLSVCMAVLALTPFGAWVLAQLFSMDSATLRSVRLYLILLLPVLLTSGLLQFYTGILVQARRTGSVLILQIILLTMVLATLSYGFSSGWRPLVTLSLSQIVPNMVYLLIAYALQRGIPHPDGAPGEAPIGIRRIMDFFWPMALTSIMLSFSRPIIFALMGRQLDPEAGIAALAVAFSLSVLFQNPINQFRHLYVTFGRQDLAGVRRFSTQVTIVSVGIMSLIAMTPLSALVFSWLLNVPKELLAYTVGAFRPLCLIPLLMLVRNYCHGISMMSMRTRSMGAGGVVRNGAVFVAGLAFYLAGRLDHVTGAAALAFGFACETAVVLAGTVGMRRELAVATEPSTA